MMLVHVVYKAKVVKVIEIAMNIQSIRDTKVEGLVARSNGCPFIWISPWDPPAKSCLRMQ